MRKVVLGLGLLMASVLYADVVSQNGIAKDSVTGLTWQDEPYTQQEQKAYDDSKNYGKTGNWEYAKQYCKDLRLGGNSDWRLPNIYELVTLIDNTKKEKPYSIDGLQNVASHGYWSSTTYAGDSSDAWGVYFDYGRGTWDYKSNSGYVRCVRGGQVNFETLSSLKKKGVLKVEQKWIDKIIPEEIKAKKEAKERAERDRKAENDRKNACSGLYPGKNMQVYTSGMFGSGYDDARVTGVDKESGQVSFEWKRGAGDWKSEETSCTHLKSQMK